MALFVASFALNEVDLRLYLEILVWKNYKTKGKNFFASYVHTSFKVFSIVALGAR